MIIKIIALVCFFALMIGVGIYSQKKVSNANDFVLGGRSVGPWVTAFSYGTSYFSAVVFIGYAGQFGWKYGIAATWAGIGNAILGSLLAWWVLGSYLCRVCRPVRLEVWRCGHLDWTWECFYRKPDGMGRSGQKNQNHDPASGCIHHAGFLRQAV